MTAPTLDLARLRRLAEEQQPDFVGPEPPQQYLAFLAAFRPTVALRLIDRLAAAEALLREVLDQHDHDGGCASHCILDASDRPVRIRAHLKEETR